MPTTPIQARDTVTLPAPPKQVWAVLADVADYPRWWPASVRVRVVSGGAEAAGTELEIQPSGGRPFTCRVESLDAPTRIGLRYHGLVEGTGEWRLEGVESGTRVTYTIDVVAHGWLVALVARLANLAEAHSGPMRDVLTSLGREVERSQR